MGLENRLGNIKIFHTTDEFCYFPKVSENLVKDINFIAEELEEIKSVQNIIYDIIPKGGLYFLLGICTIAAVKSCSQIENTNSYIQNLNDKLNANNQVLHIKNVIGKNAPEKYYIINGKRAYIEIDGKPVNKYFSK